MADLDGMCGFLERRLAKRPDTPADTRGARGLITVCVGYQPESTERLLRLLCAAFADHAAYRPEWGPPPPARRPRRGAHRPRASVRPTRLAALRPRGERGRRRLGARTTEIPPAEHPAYALLRAFAGLTRDLAAQGSVSDTLLAIARHAVEFVDGAEHAGITTWSGAGRFTTAAATGDLPHQVDDIQYSTGEGPCVEAVVEHHVVRSDDVATDPRWPVFGRLAAERTQVASMLSHRLSLEEEDSYGALNLYSCKPAAFTRHSLDVLDVYAAHAAMALSRAAVADLAANLQAAPESNRTIGAAIGILMATYKISRDDAFGLQSASRASDCRARALWGLTVRAVGCHHDAEIFVRVAGNAHALVGESHSAFE